MTELLTASVRVATSPDGAPLWVRLPDGGGRRRVERVLAHWRVETDWWAASPLRRDCWRCLLVGGDCVELACDGPPVAVLPGSLPEPPPAPVWHLLRRYD